MNGGGVFTKITEGGSAFASSHSTKSIVERMAALVWADGMGPSSHELIQASGLGRHRPWLTWILFGLEMAHMNLRAAIQLIILAMTARILAGEPVFPVKVSANGRYFVDQRGDPVFWLGTTQWQLFRDYALDEAKLILDKSKDKGFVFLQVMLMGVGDGTKTNVYGQKPWIDDNRLTPNEPYFQNVDAVVQAASDRHLVLLVMPYHQTCRKRITSDNARPWAKWLARRYQAAPNIVWLLIPEAKPEYVPVLRELAAGLHEGDGGVHLITVEPDPSPYSSSFIHDEPWLDFNSIQTWKDVKLIYPMVTKDYNLKPVKPVLMAEGAYEAGSEYGFDVSPLWVRRQAY
jgi:hypothetical protein